MRATHEALVVDGGHHTASTWLHIGKRDGTNAVPVPSILRIKSRVPSRFERINRDGLYVYHP